jgi:hypothetical protein
MQTVFLQVIEAIFSEDVRVLHQRDYLFWILVNINYLLQLLFNPVFHELAREG